MNGKCVKDPRSKASEMDSSSLLRLDIATKRDIIGIALANLIVCSYRPTTIAEYIYLIDGPFFNFFTLACHFQFSQRLYWKRASKANHGLMLTSPLRPVYPGKDKASMGEISDIPLLRPQYLRYILCFFIITIDFIRHLFVSIHHLADILLPSLLKILILLEHIIIDY